MVQMGNIRFWIIVIFISCSNNLSQSLTFDKQKGQNWRELCLAALDDAYFIYKKNIFSICPNDNSDMQFDYNRKYRAIRDFEIDLFMNTLIVELERSGIIPDSIVGINKFYHQWDEIEFPTKQMIFLVFKKNEIKHAFQVDLYDGKTKIFKIEMDYNIYFSKLKKKNNGCDESLLLISSFVGKLSKVIKVSINPENLMVFD